MQFLFGIERIFWMVVTVLTAMKERLRGAYLSLGVSKVGGRSVVFRAACFR